MKKKEESEYNQIISLFQELNKKYSTYSIGRHISTALDGYDDMWGVTNKEFLFALNKYATTLELDNSNEADDKFLSKIIEDGKHLFDEVDDEDEEEYERFD